MKRLLPAFLVFLFFALVYTVTRTALYSYDAITYALSLEFAHGLLLFHPYHLLALVPAVGLYRALAVAGSPVRALYVMQAINIVVAAL
jgi:hypothetical protein